MIQVLLTAELAEEFTGGEPEPRQFIVVKLGRITVARFLAIYQVTGPADTQGIARNTAEWLRRKLV
jgi:hypothetical protein